MSTEDFGRRAAGIVDYIGLEPVGPGEVRVTPSPELLRPTTGTVTGPVTFTLIDYAMGTALLDQVSDDEAIATVNIALNYVAAAKAGEQLVCRATVDRRNRHAATLRAEVVAGSDERLVATAIGSFAITARKR